MFVLVSRHGSLFKVLLRASTGQPGLSYVPIHKPSSVLSRVGSLLGYVGGPRDTHIALRVRTTVPLVAATHSTEG